MRNLTKFVLGFGILVGMFAAGWFFFLAPMVAEENAIHDVRSTAALMGRSPDEAEASYRRVGAGLHAQGMR